MEWEPRDVEREEVDVPWTISMRQKFILALLVYFAVTGSLFVSIEVRTMEAQQALIEPLVNETHSPTSHQAHVDNPLNSIVNHIPDSIEGEGVDEEMDPEPDTLVVEWTFNASEVFKDRTFGAGHQGCQTVWDVDGDGVNEVVLGTRGGDSERLWCIDRTGGFEWIYPSIWKDGLPGDPTSKVSLVDVDNDGVHELALAGRGGRLHIINGDGTVRWTWDCPTGSNMHGPPQAKDVDGDGFIEFFMNDNSGYVHRVSHEGDLVWTSFQARQGNQGHPTIADIDQDGGFEVLFASQDNNLYCIDADTGFEKWRFDTGANMQTNPVIVADVNDDNQYEAMVWTDTPTSSVIVLTPYGEETGRWTEPFGGSIRLGQAMGDVDGDGALEIALMSTNGGFLVDLSSLTTEWWLNFTELSERGHIPPGACNSHWSPYQTIADIDGDQEQEILWLAPYPVVTDAETGVVESFYVNQHIALERRQENGAWWGDVDNDGVSEWIVELNGSNHTKTMVYCLTMGGEFPAQSPWPEYHHTAYPAGYQREQDWLTLKSAGSNSLWFPIETPRNR